MYSLFKHSAITSFGAHIDPPQTNKSQHNNYHLNVDNVFARICLVHAIKCDQIIGHTGKQFPHNFQIYWNNFISAGLECVCPILSM